MRGGMRKLHSNCSQVGQRGLGRWQLHSVNAVPCQHDGRYNQDISGRIFARVGKAIVLVARW